MRMTSTGAFRRAFAVARPPKPPPTITTRGVFDVCSSAPLIELRLASFIHPFLKLLRPEISENLEIRSGAPFRGCRQIDNFVSASAQDGFEHEHAGSEKLMSQFSRVVTAESL